MLGYFFDASLLLGKKREDRARQAQLGSVANMLSLHFWGEGTQFEPARLRGGPYEEETGI